MEVLFQMSIEKKVPLPIEQFWRESGSLFTSLLAGLLAGLLSGLLNVPKGFLSTKKVSKKLVLSEI